jgi:DNA-binding winged helix-turn-helix (wHTH) protein
VKLRLGDVTFDPEARRLLRGDVEVRLSPKAFDLLRMLIDERPRALAKNELHGRLWPDTFVSDANLASLVAEIREALGDNARAPRFIRTAQRFGYAFCGATEAASVSTTPGEAAFCWLIRDGRRIPLHAGENILGRDSDDGVRIDSPTVSRRHARIVIGEGGATLEDLASKNGTFVGAVAVSASTALGDGDEIRVGSVVLRFRMATGAQTATWTEP